MSKNNTKQEVFAFNQYLSMIDLSLHPKFLEYSKDWDEKILEQMLYDLGADIEKNGYEMYMQTHVPRTNERMRIHCQRFVFTERTDKWWIDNGMMLGDIVRNHPSSIVRVGMRLAQNEGKGDTDRVKARMVSSDIKCKEGK